MQSKISSKSKWSLFIVSIIGITFFSINIFSLSPDLLPDQSSNTKASIINIQAQPIDLPIKPSSVKSILPTIVQPLKNPTPKIPTSKIPTSKIPIENNKVEPIQIISPQEPVSLELSLRLKIPKINVDAKVESVGVTADGTMDIPKDLTALGWYNLGVSPGSIGTAVIAGHYGWWKDGILGVFNDLNKLQKGDKLSFEDKKGVITTFVVRESRSYNSNADASDVFGSSDGKSHLNLITCDGVWDEASKSYSTRLVVFTDKE